MTNIGMPEKRHHQIDLPEEDWPVPQSIPLPEEDPAQVPDPVPERHEEPVSVPA